MNETTTGGLPNGATSRQREVAALATLLMLAAGFVGYFIGARSGRPVALIATGHPLRGIRLNDADVLPPEGGGFSGGGSLTSVPEGRPVAKAPRTQVMLKRVNLPGVRDKVNEDARSRLREGGVPLVSSPPIDPDGYSAVPSPGDSSYLTLDLDTRSAGPLIHFRVAAWLARPVYLTPEPGAFTLATVWRGEMSGTVPRKDAPAAVRAAADQLMAGFVSNYQTANPPDAR